jgi:hypothetical protein
MVTAKEKAAQQQNAHEQRSTVSHMASGFAAAM